MRSLLACSLLLLFLLPAAGHGQAGLKVFISADMEGVVGAVTAEQLGPGGFEYERFRGFMTDEVLAAIEGARAAGATEILVADAHGNGQNLLIERLPDDVMVVRSWPRSLGMMEGIDSTFDAALLLGYHSATTNPRGVRAHTFSSANLAAVRLNGVPIAESGMSAAIAGHFGVPVVLITGDDVAVGELREAVPGVEGAVVKRAISFHSAATMTPAAARALIRRRAEAAVRKAGEVRAAPVSYPVTLDVTFKNYRPAEVMAFLPNVERVDAHTVRFVGRDIVEISRFLQFLGHYQAGLSP